MVEELHTLGVMMGVPVWFVYLRSGHRGRAGWDGLVRLCQQLFEKVVVKMIAFALIQRLFDVLWVSLVFVVFVGMHGVLSF